MVYFLQWFKFFLWFEFSIVWDFYGFSFFYGLGFLWFENSMVWVWFFFSWSKKACYKKNQIKKVECSEARITSWIARSTKTRKRITFGAFKLHRFRCFGEGRIWWSFDRGIRDIPGWNTDLWFVCTNFRWLNDWKVSWHPSTWLENDEKNDNCNNNDPHI